MKDAFLYYAADDAVLYRNGKVIKGKEEIEEYFNQQTLKKITLQW